MPLPGLDWTVDPTSRDGAAYGCKPSASHHGKQSPSHRLRACQLNHDGAPDCDSMARTVYASRRRRSQEQVTDGNEGRDVMCSLLLVWWVYRVGPDANHLYYFLELVPCESSATLCMLVLARIMHLQRPFGDQVAGRDMCAQPVRHNAYMHARGFWTPGL